MKEPFRKLGPIASALVREESLSFWLAEFHAADAQAHAALEAVADFASEAKLWEKPAVEKMAALTMIAYEAEARRRVVRTRLLREYGEYVRAMDKLGGKQA